MGGRSRAVGGLVAACLALGVGGCGSSSSDGGGTTSGADAGDAPSVDGDVPGPKVVIEGGDSGLSAQVGSQIPDDLPDVVVLPEGYDPINVTSEQMQGETSYTMVGTADGDAATVAGQIEGAYEVEAIRTDAADVIALKYDDIDGIGIEYTMQDNADGVAVVTVGVYPRLR